MEAVTGVALTIFIISISIAVVLSLLLYISKYLQRRTFQKTFGFSRKKGSVRWQLRKVQHVLNILHHELEQSRKKIIQHDLTWDQNGSIEFVDDGFATSIQLQKEFESKRSIFESAVLLAEKEYGWLEIGIRLGFARHLSKEGRANVRMYRQQDGILDDDDLQGLPEY